MCRVCKKLWLTEQVVHPFRTLWETTLFLRSKDYLYKLRAMMNVGTRMKKHIEPANKIDKTELVGALDASSLPNGRWAKRMRQEEPTAGSHFESPMRKYNLAVLRFCLDKSEENFYILQTLCEAIWGRTLTLPETLEVLIFGHPCKSSHWSYVERGCEYIPTWSVTRELQQEANFKHEDIVVLYEHPDAKHWGPFLAEYYNLRFDYNPEASPFYYFRQIASDSNDTK